MSHPHYELARAYFSAVTAGELPDSLLTEDFSAWTTSQGAVGKAAYQAMIRLLRTLCAEPIAFTIDALTAEDDRVIAEARSKARLVNGEDYAMTYVFSFRIRGERIAWIAEHFNTAIVAEKLMPLIPGR